MKNYKIKNTYKKKLSNIRGILKYNYIIVNNYRSPKTHSELKKNNMFFNNIECDKYSYLDFYFKNKINRRCRKNLPNIWDEIYPSIFDNEKSWKHYSKRKKQWISLPFYY